MATNARIERLTREALAISPQAVAFPAGTLKALCHLAIGLAAIGAFASTIGARDVPETTSHSFVGVTPAASAEGNVLDLTY